MSVMGSLVRAFAGGVAGFFALLVALAFVLLCWACGIVSALFLLAAAWQGAAWAFGGSVAVGTSALGCLGISAVAFAAVTVLGRAAGLLRERVVRPRSVSMAAVGRLRLAR